MSVFRIGITIQAFDQCRRFLPIHTAPLNQELHYFLIRRNDAGKTADFGGHVGHRGPFIDAQGFNRLARIFHDFGQCLAAANVVQAQNLQNEIFCCNVRVLRSPNHNLH